MLLREIIVVCSEMHTQYTSTPRGIAGIAESEE
jgi:hypothetical protein